MRFTTYFTGLIYFLALILGILYNAQLPSSQNLSEGKVLLLFFTTENCLPCEKQKEVFKAITFKNVELVETKNEVLRSQFNIDSFPTCVLLDADGKENKRVEGFLNREMFLEWLGK